MITSDMKLLDIWDGLEHRNNKVIASSDGNFGEVLFLMITEVRENVCFNDIAKSIFSKSCIKVFWKHSAPDVQVQFLNA